MARASVDLVLVHPFLYTRGGAERVVLEVAKRFHAHLYVSRYEPEHTFSEFASLPITVLPRGALRVLPRALPSRVRDAAIAGEQFFMTKIRDDYDVINAQGTPSEWIRNRNERVLWYCHTPNREAFDLYQWRMSRRSLPQKLLYWTFIQPYRVLESWTVPLIEEIVCNSMNTQQRIKRYLNRDAEVIHPGIDVESFTCEAYEPFFFYPSRITPEKRFEIAIAAFKQFKKKLGAEAERWKLMIAGALLTERKEHVAYYESLVHLLGNDGRIIVNPSDEEFKSLYKRCTAVLYTPVNEDFGLVPLEALASYKPCIAINEGGPREVIKEGIGFLISTPEEMAEKMLLFARDPALAETMGKRGRAHVEKHFTWDVFFQKFEQAVRRVARSKMENEQ